MEELDESGDEVDGTSFTTWLMICFTLTY